MRNQALQRPLLGALASVALLTTVAACGGADAGTAAKADGKLETTNLKVGIVPVIDHAAVFIANQQGFFKEEGLTVETQAVQGGAAAVPALMSGDLQAAFATYPSFLLAESQNLGVTIVAEGVRATETTGGVYVAATSSIKDAAGLAGKTIAVNTLNNTGDITIKAVLKEQGVDPGTVKFIELPFPDMKPALDKGSVDAAWLVEPFRTAVAGAGGRMVLKSYSGVAEGIPVSGLGMSDAFVAKNPDTAAAFGRAVEKANAYIAADPERARQIVTTYSQTKPEQAAAMELPKWTAGKPDVDQLTRWNDLMVQTGALTKPVDVAAMVLGK
ncbi:ABC transporter substrate-binding protein [Micromonospora globispora]|uniref:ABC transporter substrate-binding protein n=1 Tax=Micromonospora globispora TaxID=1450148 RepID=UPI0014034C77|nr:ABC transporter substrate-binding protein [Micromonospora globispora]